MEEKKNFYWLPLIFGGIGFIVVLGIWIATPCIIRFLISFKYNWDLYGTFGDSFGVVNSLFSGLATVLLVVAIIYQRREIQLQKEELKDTREVMEKQEKQFEIQSETLRLQQFENTFFNMLNLHNEITQNVRTKIDNRNYLHGRECFHKYYNRLREIYGTPGAENNINYTFDEFFKKYRSEIAHYFENLFHIIKTIVKCNIVEKDFYIKTIRSLLTNHELILFAYYIIIQMEWQEIKPLLIESEFFEAIPSDLFLDSSHLSNYFK